MKSKAVFLILALNILAESSVANSFDQRAQSRVKAEANATIQKEVGSFFSANRDFRRVIQAFSQQQGGATQIRLTGSLVCLSYNFQKYIFCDKAVRTISNQEIDSSRYFLGDAPYNQWKGPQVLYVYGAEVDLNNGKICRVDAFGYFPKKGPLMATCYDQHSRKSQVVVGKRLAIPLINKRFEKNWN